MKRYFDKHFDEIRNEFGVPEKKIKTSEQVFKKNSCKIQNEFNQEQFELVQKALKYIRKAEGGD